MSYYEQVEREHAFNLGYQKALTNVVLMGCICHERNDDTRGECPVCEAVHLAEKALNTKTQGAK